MTRIEPAGIRSRYNITRMGARGWQQVGVITVDDKRWYYFSRARPGVLVDITNYVNQPGAMLLLFLEQIG